jgi:hypothetical protein
MALQYTLVPSLNCSCDVATLYVLPMKQHELHKLRVHHAHCHVMHCYMTVLVTLVPPSCHINEVIRKTNLRGSLGSFTETFTENEECALDEHA